MKTEKKRKPGYPKMLMLAAVVFAGVMAAGPREAMAATDPIRFEFGGGHALIAPLQNVSGTQLYSVRFGKGYPALESVVYRTPGGRRQASVGAAAELGESKAVPFVGLQARLSERFFDTSNNDLFFGIAAAKHFGPEVSKKSWRGVEITLKASTALW